MNLFHLSAECYPVAKSGGLGDVVGALPLTQRDQIDRVTVVLPAYGFPWFNHHSPSRIYSGEFPFRSSHISYEVMEYAQDLLGYRLLAINIPGLTDRPGIYIDPESGAAYWDELDRFLCFQIAFLDWISHHPAERQGETLFHCHDHHTALIPFMSRYCDRFQILSDIPKVLTIHNGEYQGRYDMSFTQHLPSFSQEHIGLLEWGGQFNALACGIKCAWRVTTVSPGYMDELMMSCQGLELLLQAEQSKTRGILNGIDTKAWNPESDALISTHYSSRNVSNGKHLNKEILMKEFDLKMDRPLFSFIGRLVHEKGADLLPDVIRKAENEGLEASFLVLGTGERWLHDQFFHLKHTSFGYFDTRLEYNERLAHQIYAGSDFLLMPSRVEPCGLNQLYAMRYGTIPIVRSVGGLRDTVLPIHQENGRIREQDGYGFVFHHFSVDDLWSCIEEAVSLWSSKTDLLSKRRQIMKLDFSWKKSSDAYLRLYKEIL